jgi:endonuclease-3
MSVQPMRVEKHQKQLVDVRSVIEGLRAATRGMAPPASQEIVSRFGRDTFLILISCLLSLRTKDTVSLPASFRLFDHARTPHELLALPTSTLEVIIYPVGFYKRKAALLHSVSHELLTRFKGIVPNTKDALLSIKGVGLKTANLVLAEGFCIPALCVDTHVHRISNRLGLVNTQTPHETEAALQCVLPKEYWIEWNRLLVMWGQNICVPISPFCSRCPIAPFCQRKDVVSSR